MNKKMQRRAFLRGAAAATSACCLSTVVPKPVSILATPAWAQSADNHIKLFWEYIEGGYDLLNALAPLSECQNGGTLALARSVSRMFPDPNNNIALASGMIAHAEIWASMQSLWNEGKVAIFAVAGAESKNGSHEGARQDIGIGRALGNENDKGFLARFNDNFSMSSTIPSLRFLDLANGRDWFVGAEENTTFANNLGDFGLDGGTQYQQNLFRLASLLSTGASGEDPEALYNGVGKIEDVAATVQSALTQTLPGNFFGNTAFENRAQDAALAASIDGVRAIGFERGGYDSHGGQNNLQGANGRMAEPWLAMSALANTLKLMPSRGAGANMFDDSFIVTSSEFGRTTRENGNFGHDHENRNNGIAVVGGRVKGGVYSVSSATSMTSNNFERPTVGQIMGPILNVMNGENPLTGNTAKAVFPDDIGRFIDFVEA